MHAAGSANVTRRRPMAACSAIIYARRIENGLTLLHADRDFGPFAVHLGIVAIHQRRVRWQHERGHFDPSNGTLTRSIE